ncbi:MAG: TRZ/ATZ family hydrolase [Gammaproteobacteria bacterium]|nr:TRZ/ATZ family hydrolase [Gammaproteobacteria bacterium]
MTETQPKTIDTLVRARWIIPVEPAGVVLEHHALALDAGRIVDLLPAREAAERYRAAQEVTLATHALIPGLVNAHTHAAMNLFKGMADDMPLMSWLKERVWPAESRWVSEAFVLDGTLLAAAEMLQGGVTCFNDMYFYPEEAARAATGCGMRAVVGLIVLDFPTVWARDADEYLAKATEVHDRLRDDPLVRTAFAPHAPYSVADAALARVRTLADELDIPVHMHVHETAREVRDAVRATGERPLSRLDRLGLLTPRLAAVHMTQLEPAEIERVAKCGVSVVHCPESNLKLASGLCPVAALARAGVNLAIGTDGAASNNDLDVLGELRTGSLLAKGVSGDAGAVPAAAALTMATLGGARALGLEAECGSLTPGKAADVVAIDLSGPDTQPVHSALSQVVYSVGRHLVSDVWVAGQPVLRDGRLLHAERAELAERAERWRRRIAGETARD